jgi:BirA family biotin operon repressor/biotin-[acetyl-CoA-carboxylase] ligase
MDDARGGADVGGACGTAYVAGEQSAGRGRQGRTWVSATTVGLYVTYHLCPRETRTVPLVGAAAGLAVADAIATTAGFATVLKWPNDVQHEGRKLAGILSEARHGTRLDVFLGIGVNLRGNSALPADVAALATSIEEAGGSPPSREALLAALSDELDRRLEQLDRSAQTLVDDWSARLVTIGQRVRLETPGGPVDGEAMGVTERGELIIRGDDGNTAQYSAGDVTTP